LKRKTTLTEETMRKTGDLFLKCSGSKLTAEWDGICNTVLVCDYISGATGSFSTFEHIRDWYYANHYGTEEQNKKYVPKLASGEWFGAYCLQNQVQDLMLTLEKRKQFIRRWKNTSITGQKNVVSNAGFL
jgi:alkylation response protein AidB-like acyl-CoA dehydrogenase